MVVIEKYKLSRVISENHNMTSCTGFLGTKTCGVLKREFYIFDAFSYL